MSKHTAVRIKGSRWQAVAHNARRSPLVDAPHRPMTPDQARRSATMPTGEDDMLLDLALRHFADLELAAGDARELAAALLRVMATGETVRVSLNLRSDPAYVFSRRVTAVDIRFGQSRMRIPLHAAIQLAHVLEQHGGERDQTDIAA